MAKSPIQPVPEVRPDRRRSRLVLIAALLVLIPPMIPIILEAMSLCYAQWNRILDGPVVVRTPILDSISERIAVVREDLRYQLSSGFDRVSWDLSLVLPILVVVVAIGVMLLRR